MPCRNFHAAEAAAFETCGRLREVIVHAVNFIDGKRARYRPTEIVRECRCADCFRVTSRFVASTAGVLYLAEQTAVVRFDGIGPALEAVELVVVVSDDFVRDVLMPRHAERLGHDHCCTTTRAIGVVVQLTLGDSAFVAHARGHRRMHDAIFQALAGEGVGRKQCGIAVSHIFK